MTDTNTPFLPDWLSPPGETISDIAEERGWSQGELARRLSYTEKHLSLLIHGKVPLTVDAAQRLERVLGGTAEFWLTREAKYQQHKARLESEERCAKEVGWLDKMPVKELMDCGAIPRMRNDGKNKPKIVEACLRFFGVQSSAAWEKHYASMQMAFRRTRTEQSDVAAISAWLRLGELKAEALSLPGYDRAAFESALRDIRTLTRKDPGEFWPAMQQQLHEAGVLLVMVPSIPKAHVSGIARWLNKRPMIQLSLYGKLNDRFWFSFFHEAAHLLLHASNKEEKSSIFLDDLGATYADDPKEHEANEWARDWLIPPEHAEALRWLNRKEEIIDFADQLNIHPGIVVGRLQHEGIIDYRWFNDLKQSLPVELLTA